MAERALLRAASFLKARFRARDEDAVWLSFSVLVAAAGSLTFLIKNAGVPFGIQSDASQFLSWMSRFDDPASLRGDLVADYWQSVSPWFFRLTYHAAWWIGIEPVAFAHILPALLFPLGSLFAFRFVRSIGAEPLVAGLTAAVIIYVLAHDNAVVSATPRAFRPILFLALMDGLARRGVIETALAQMLLAGTYPQTALVMASVIGLTVLSPASPFVDLQRRRLTLVLVSAIATALGILPFLLASHQFDPTVTFAAALDLPTFGAAGRNHIVQPDGSIDFLCDDRLGLFGSNCKGPGDLWLYAVAAAIMAGPVILLRRAWRDTNVQDETRRIRSPLPFGVLVASLAWFALSAAMLFRLHLPSRYSATLGLLAPLSTFPVVVERLRASPLAARLIEGKGGRLGFASVTVVIGALSVAGAISVPNVMKRPSEPHLIDFIRATPPDAVMAGFVTDLDFAPVLAARRTLFSLELSIGYQLGYLRPLMQRMSDMRDAVLTHDPAVLADRLASNHVDFLFIPADMLATPRLPRGFRGFFDEGELAGMETAAARGGLTALALAAERCVKATFGTVLVVDGACLAGSKKRPHETRQDRAASTDIGKQLRKHKG